MDRGIILRDYKEVKEISLEKCNIWKGESRSKEYMRESMLGK